MLLRLLIYCGDSGWKWPSSLLGRCPGQAGIGAEGRSTLLWRQSCSGSHAFLKVRSTSYKFLGCKAKMHEFSDLLFSPEKWAQTSEGHPIPMCRKNLPWFSA